MPTFQYEALNKAGQPQKGTIEASSSEEAISHIKSQGYFPTNVREKRVKKKGGGGSETGTSRTRTKAGGGGGAGGGAGEKKKSSAGAITFGGVKEKQITQFSRQMSTLQDAGLPILRSLNILAEQEKPGKFKTVLEDIALEVEGGSALSEAMAKHPKAFDRLYTKMIAAGEVGGVLDIILQRLADFMEKAQKLRKQIRGAMVYPAAVITIAVLIVTGIMVFIIPKFQKIFADFDAELPGLTVFLIQVSQWVANGGWIWIICGPILALIAMKAARKTEGGRKMLDLTKARIPVLGRLNKAGSIARFSRTLGTLISAGVPILDAIAITRDTVGNYIYERALQRVHDSIREGESFADPLRETKVADLIVVNMIDVGEETGELDRMLTKIADNYDEEVENLVAAMVALLEPMLVVVLGLVVGTIVVALFLPLPTLIQSVM